MNPLRVCIDARLGSGLSGGVEQVVIGLAAGLSRLDDGSEDYLFLTHTGRDEWLHPYIKGPGRILPSRMEYAGEAGIVPELRRRTRSLPFVRGTRDIPASDGTLERSGSRLVHFAHQEAFLTDLPSIYQPHDLQHLHLPEMFSERERRRRERVYRTHCERAALVVAMTSWGRRDLIQSYGIPEEKVAVVPWGSVLDEYPAPGPDDLDQIRARLSLSEAFLLFPGQTWPHKNHEGLLEALALLRDRDATEVPVVCPGRRNHYFPRVEERARELGLEGAVTFPGFVSPLELRALYSLARGLVFPSRFEGWGLPVCEAFSAGLPVASSSATSLPGLVGDAGLLFDPDNPEVMAAQILRLWTDERLRRNLAEKGRKRARLFSIDHTARLFRAHYRRIAGAELSDSDGALLAAQPPA
jgi:glycosyltransferase involved in cell wall biosynthesis